MKFIFQKGDKVQAVSKEATCASGDYVTAMEKHLWQTGEVVQIGVENVKVQYAQQLFHTWWWHKNDLIPVGLETQVPGVGKVVLVPRRDHVPTG